MRSRATAFAAIVLVALLLAGLATLAACGQGASPGTLDSGSTTSSTAGGDTSTSGAPPSGAETGTFTVDGLARFDGKNGSRAYVAVDGVVYDLTGSAFWKDGEHSSCDLGAMAGRDLSDMIKQAPARMRAALEGMPVVGTLSQ